MTSFSDTDESGTIDQVVVLKDRLTTHRIHGASCRVNNVCLATTEPKQPLVIEIPDIPDPVPERLAIGDLGSASRLGTTEIFASHRRTADDDLADLAGGE